MRIALLCMSAEPGWDGVGDYVRQFARALSARGHSCQVVALADRFVHQPCEMVDPNGGIDLVRIPAAHWHRADIGLAVDRLAAFAPEWVSLQMVCYGFEERGLLWRSAARFARLRASPKRHMMFHELWIGAGQSSPPKDRAVGWLQRKLLVRATQVWSPSVVHTSNALYREMLRRVDVVAEELAVPSNIPVCPVDLASARGTIVRRLETQTRTGCGTEPLLAGLFGTLHPGWNDIGWVDRLSGLCGRLGRRLVIVQLGRIGATGRRLLDACRRDTAVHVDFLELGQLPAEEISAVLQGLDFGVSTTPWPLIGKSGTASAMLEHGLPVLVTREGDGLRHGPTPAPSFHPQLFRFREFCAALESGVLVRAKPQPRLDIYQSFIDALERAS